jgi:hypothetical protein
MQWGSCSEEAAVVKAARTGLSCPETDAHLAACTSCREAAQAARWMQSLAGGYAAKVPGAPGDHPSSEGIGHPRDGRSEKPRLSGAGETPALLQTSRGDAGTTAQREASWLWCKALLEEKAAEARRARRRLMLVELGCAMAVAFLLAGWMAWNWPLIEASFSGLTAAAVGELFGAVAWLVLPSVNASPVSFTLLLVLGGAAALLASYPLLSEE